MTQTSTIQNGTYYKLWAAISGVQTVIGYGKTMNEEISRTMIDVTSQASGMYTDVLPGRFASIKFSGSFLLKESTTGVGVSYTQLLNLMTATTPTAFTMQLHSGNVGDQHVNATVFIENLKKAVSDNGAVTYDASFISTSSFASATS